MSADVVTLTAPEPQRVISRELADEVIRRFSAIKGPVSVPQAAARVLLQAETIGLEPRAQADLFFILAANALKGAEAALARDRLAKSQLRNETE